MGNKNAIRYRDLKDRAFYTGAAVMDELIKAVESEPDKVRYILGSVAFRKIEEYKSLKVQAEAAFSEWINEQLKEPNPFV